MRGADFVSNYRQAVGVWLAALDACVALRRQYDALDLGNALDDDAFTGPNDDITRDDLVAAVSSMGAIDEFFLAGHATNLYKMRR